MSAPNESDEQHDAGVRVVVTPAQSSYFAGEPFSVTVTFTNTRSPETLNARPSHSHKRAAHSISSAPLARPPTSPGTPRTAVPTFKNPRSDADDRPVRKGLVGTGRRADEVPQMLEQSRKRLLARSLSLDIAPHEVESQLSPKVSAAPGQPSPLARSPSQPIPSSHPHARKQSVLDGQLQLHDMSQSGPPSPHPSSASTSAFSLSLDPIAESAQTTPKADTHAYPPRPPPRRPSQLGLGHGPPPHLLHPPPRSATFTPPNTELILYSYAQLAGSLSLVPLPGATATPDQMRTLHGVRAALVKRRVVGGGSMDIGSSLQAPPRRRSHGRAASFSTGIMSLLSPSPSVSAQFPQSQSWSPTHRPRIHSVAGFAAQAGGDAEDEVDPEAPLPTFETQPAMLAVDLSLGPGESRSYTYTVPLPAVLPPTFKGRSLRFAYELIIGTCRAGQSPHPGATGPNSTSRVMKVPIRVYNNVVVGKQPTPYDLLWPVAKRKMPTPDGAVVTENVGKKSKDTARPLPSSTDDFDRLQEYAHRLLEAFPEPHATGVRMKLPAEAMSPLRGDLEREREREEEGALTGCREAVEILTRNPKKASYDVNKDGVKVAVLTFTKSAYRLGETVLGVVELNDRTSRARVLKLSAILESHESLPSSISSSSNSKHLRRTHAEHHSSFVLSTLRTTFALDIPSDASPAFQVNVGRPPSGGLEWKVRLCLLVAVAAESSLTGTEGVRLKHLVRDGPRGEWGSSWKATDGLTVLERPDPAAHLKPSQAVAPQGGARSWASFFTASFLGAAEVGYHDGDDIEDEEEAPYDDGVDYGGGEEGWRNVKVETVECEVPIKVWPGNTAFKAMDVVFDV
ncbi:hypothetical protein PLICRDRAFT_56036 [Plicaturopsis crispa FD-325 SS-3]|nr:hypothetical protein PLICRDRAFT_56036 [Plicaturopsis crispa FD-325 SS-3]